VRASPGPIPRDDQLTRLLNLCQSELERRWLRLVDELQLKLPSDAQKLVESCGVRPDFLYRDEGVAVFVDGPLHDAPDQRAKDNRDQDALEDHGLTVIRFHHAADWEPILRRYPTLFGAPTVAPGPAVAPETAEATGFDPENFDAAWRPLMTQLAAADGLVIEPGNEVMSEGRVIDLDLATLRRAGRTVRLVDDARASADEVANALAAEGQYVLRARANEPDVLARILAALEG
jgi:very-short-patch-repair endonuclease